MQSNSIFPPVYISLLLSFHTVIKVNYFISMSVERLLQINRLNESYRYEPLSANKFVRCAPTESSVSEAITINFHYRCRRKKTLRQQEGDAVNEEVIDFFPSQITQTQSSLRTYAIKR